MTDVFSKQKRSWIMRQVRAENTLPEKLVRSLIHRLGYRFRLHRNDLPGKPDIVFPARKKVIFVHGCFWHGHNCQRGRRIPKTNTRYWRRKIKNNVERHSTNQTKLRKLGWHSLTVWECQIKDSERLQARIESFLK